MKNRTETSSRWQNKETLHTELKTGVKQSPRLQHDMMHVGIMPNNLAKKKNVYKLILQLPTT